MKKSILAVAVAVCVSAPAVAMADATLYGHVTVAVDKVKDEKLNIGGDANSTSRIGLRGTADTGMDGVTALYQYEFAVNKTNGEQALKTRQANVGLTGNFGTVKAGTQSTPQDSWINGTTDVMLSSIHEVTHSTGTAPSRISNSLAYVSPEFSGFQFALATAANSGNDDENLDLYHAAVKYSNAGFYGALGYIDYNSEAAFADKQSEMGLALEYDFGVGTISGVYSHVKNNIANDYKPWDIAATYIVSDSTTLKAAYADHKEGAKGFGVEVQHDLSKMVNTFVGYGHANSDLEDTGTNNVFSTGIRVRF